MFKSQCQTLTIPRSFPLYLSVFSIHLSVFSNHSSVFPTYLSVFSPTHTCYTQTKLCVLHLTLVQLTVRTDFPVSPVTTPGLFYTISRSISTLVRGQLSHISHSSPPLTHLRLLGQPDPSPRSPDPDPRSFDPGSRSFDPGPRILLPPPLHGLHSTKAPVH